MYLNIIIKEDCKIIILTGHSAAGKTVCEREMERRGYKRIISYTTRPIRENEKKDVDYHYVTEEEFKSKDEDFWAETTYFRGWHYGLAKEDCIDDAVAVIEIFGLLQLKQNKDLHIKSFYLKTSDRTRLIRMLQRGDDITEAIRRMYSDQGTFSCVENYVDFIITNEGRTVEQTVDQIINLINFWR